MKKHVPYWATILLLVGALIFKFFTGGVVNQVIETKDGCKFNIEVEISDSVLQLADDCKMKKAGEKCKANFGFEAIKLNECEDPITTKVEVSDVVPVKEMKELPKLEVLPIKEVKDPTSNSQLSPPDNTSEKTEDSNKPKEK